ncbi:hypothetical protein H072_10935 [Dactylellina haptotyla CBS 200.50]|uniref:Uncharacterized protein n=1 Tax=Dactylellina haptotyla (strain CBS 200.50) TaxID=1284197 RepID=S8BK98_DACHA|nr:hypothetical protein H072_10935 [Dactylellina haptotyla CBS 200.50]
MSNPMSSKICDCFEIEIEGGRFSLIPTDCEWGCRGARPDSLLFFHSHPLDRPFEVEKHWEDAVGIYCHKARTLAGQPSSRLLYLSDLDKETVRQISLEGLVWRPVYPRPENPPGVWESIQRAVFITRAIWPTVPLIYLEDILEGSYMSRWRHRIWHGILKIIIRPKKVAVSSVDNKIKNDEKSICEI